MPGGGKSPYPKSRVRVDRTPAMPGAPRVRKSTLTPGGKAKHQGDSRIRTGVNAGDAQGSVWGSRVAPVTGRKSNKRPGWESRIAGGQRIEAAGV